MSVYSIVVPLFYDLSIRNWTTTAGGTRIQPALILGQSQTVEFVIQFVQDGVVVELAQAMVAPSFIIRPINLTSAPILADVYTVTPSGSGPTKKYTFYVTLTSLNLTAWLATVDQTTNYAAICLADTVNEIVTLPALTCTILPDYTL